MSKLTAAHLTVSRGLVELGSIALAKLYQQTGSLTKLAELSQLKNLGEGLSFAEAGAFCTRTETDIVTIEDNAYPELLREIADPPLVLYVRGSLTKAGEHTVAIVGTRKLTHYGTEAAKLFSKGLARAGVTVVSGLAHGIDGVAHRATLEVLGRTIAVLPGGIDTIYPREHEQLAHEIVRKGGAVVSEFPLGTLAYRSNFGVRNRIIAGLSQGTVVIEAAERSGTLLTARSTLEYNRELFAVPHPIFSPMGVAPNRLISLGAKLVTEPNDVLEELSIEVASHVSASRDLLPSSLEEVAVWDLVSSEPRHVDELVNLSGLAVAKLQPVLTMMELNGLVRNLGGNFYVRAQGASATRKERKR